MNKTRRSLLITGLVALCLAAIGLLCPLVYDLNDDITLRSILSGAYSGTPDGHAVYMKYPLTGLISLLYRIFRPAPWFDLVMAGFFVISISSVLCRTAALTGAGRGWQKRSSGRHEETADSGESVWSGGGRIWPGIATACMVFLCAGLYLMNFMKMHYTVVAAMLGGAALFLVVTDSFEERGWPGGLRRSAPAALLLLLCYDVRSQVFFLILPFLGVALLWQIRKGALRQILIFAGLSAAVTSVCMIWNAGMYSGSGWKEYEAYNESRTQLYDYTEPLPYETYSQVYEELGISQDQYRLLVQYDTALDNSVDGELLAKAAGASFAERDRQRSQKEYIKECIIEYYYYLRYTGKPYNYLVLLGYCAVVAAAALRRRPGRVLLAFCMGAGRSLIWVYLIWKGRFPERIYVSLYLIELMLLAGMLLRQAMEDKNRGRLAEDINPKRSRGRLSKFFQRYAGIFTCAVSVILCLALAVFAAERFAQGYGRARQQQEVQEEWEALTQYCESHEDMTYLLDVTSMVAYSGMQFEHLPDRQNYLLAGGWMSRTPLLMDRLHQLGASDGAQALLKTEQVSFIAGADRDLGWLEDYMARRFGTCRMEKADTVELEGRDIFTVYRFYVE